MNINIILCILFILIICTYYINNFLNVKEGIIFSKDYFLDKYEKDGKKYSRTPKEIADTKNNLKDGVVRGFLSAAKKVVGGKKK